MENELNSFKVDHDIKEEFLDSQKKSTRTFYSYVLTQADEYESEIGKSLYNFNIEDRDELLLVKFKNKTHWAFQSNLTPLRKYVDFCISKKLVRHNENRFATILPQDYSNYVSVQAMENSYLSKEQIRELEDKLINEQDKLMLELLSWGVRGRTEKGNTLEELVNLRVRDIGWDEKILVLMDNDGEVRYVEVDDYTLELIKRTINQRFYFFNNGFKTKKNENGIFEKSEKGAVINETDYVFRVPGKNKFGKTESCFFEGRIQRIQKWLERPYLTISNLYFSGMINYARELKNKETIYDGKVSAQGELIKEDYIRINEIFDFGENGERYIYKTQELVSMYV